MSKRERNWKPIVMTIEDIEYDLRISRTKFYEWVAQGWMPKPHISTPGLSRWLTSEIQEHLERFPDRASLDAEVSQQAARIRELRGQTNERPDATTADD